MYTQKASIVYFIVGQCRQRTKQIEDVIVSSQATFSASPFRPPPAPPLPPPSPIKSTRCLVVKVQPKTERERDNSFLEELSKRPPKLRHVELSPGGRPVRVRRSSSSNDPSGLSYVLKKRYIALHNSPRLSLDRCKSSPSFSWELLFFYCYTNTTFTYLLLILFCKYYLHLIAHVLTSLNCCFVL